MTAPAASAKPEGPVRMTAVPALAIGYMVRRSPVILRNRPPYAAAPHGAPAASARWNRTTTPSNTQRATPKLDLGHKGIVSDRRAERDGPFASPWTPPPWPLTRFRQLVNSPGCRSAFGEGMSGGWSSCSSRAVQSDAPLRQQVGEMAGQVMRAVE